SGHNYLPKQLYSLNFKKKKRFVDCLIYTGPVHKTPLPVSVFKPFFIAITEDNHMLRFDNKNGELLQQVFLGNGTKFRHIDWETQGETILLQSIPHRPNNLKLLQVALFTVYPIEFIASFEIEKEIFGSDIKSANLSEGLLIVSSGSSSSKCIRLYSLEHILEEQNFLCKCKLNETCETLKINEQAQKTFELDSTSDSRKVGIHGLPINVNVKCRPPLLFEIECSDQIVYFGGYPWHYIYSPIKHKGVFELRNLSTHQLALNGHFDVENDTTEPDTLSFHVDDTGRLIYMSSYEIIIYKLITKNNETSVLKQFVLTLNPTFSSLAESNSEQINTKRVTSSRKCAHNKRYYEDMDERLILADDFENELNIFSILGMNQDSKYGKIVMFDNESGNLVKEVELKFKLYEECDYTLIMDVDTFIIIVKDVSNNWCVHVFRLTKIDEFFEFLQTRKKSRKRRFREVMDSVCDGL
ncbi:DDB1- and CUL4-associated factor 17-like protein, partial [Dinothrombium tinctorium]